MQMTYAQLSTDELHGTSQADYLVSIEGDLQITDDGDYVYDKPSFPVVELARSLLVWLAEPDRGTMSSTRCRSRK